MPYSSIGTVAPGTAAPTGSPQPGIGTVAPGTAAPSAVGGMGGGYLWVRRSLGNGKYETVRVHVSKLTPAQQAAARASSLNKPGGAPNLGAPAGGGPASPPPAAVIDPRDGEYQSQLGQYAFDRDRGIAEQNAELAKLPALYNRGAQDIRTGYLRNRNDSNAELAARGIVRSGEYQKRGADRLMQQVNQTADLERTYGAGAQSAIAARLAEINQQYALQEASALQAAKDRYAQRYPASPYLTGAA